MWFRPNCPVSVEEKAWIESRMSWLCEQFGRERAVQCPVILPTAEFFPDRYNRTYLLNRYRRPESR